MSEADLRALVRWTVEDAPPGARAGRVLGGLLHLVSTVATFGADASSGARRPTWDLPADADAYLDLGPVELRLPATARAEQLRATRRDVWVTRSAGPPQRVPVETLRVLEAVPGTGSSRPRQAEARWTLTVTDGSRTGSLTGAWLALAWIGHLAGWPEPRLPT